MKNIIIAKRYAKAAIQSLSPEKYHEVLEQLVYMKEIFKNHKALKILTSTVIKVDHKIELVNEVTENIKNKEYWEQMFKVLILKKRCHVLEQFFIEFEDLLYKSLNQKKINLIFAHQQDEETINGVKKEIEKILCHSVVCDVSIDKSIIGGFIAKSREKVIDASVKSNLKRFIKEV